MCWWDNAARIAFARGSTRLEVEHYLKRMAKLQLEMDRRDAERRKQQRLINGRQLQQEGIIN